MARPDTPLSSLVSRLCTIAPMPSVPSFNPPQRILMGPGPSGANPRVIRAMTAPILGHLDPEFLKIMDNCRAMLRQVLRTENTLTLATPGTGTSGMEAAVMNLVEPGDKVVVGVAGYFADRICQMAERAGGVVTRVDRALGFTRRSRTGEERCARRRPGEARRHRPRGNLDRRPDAGRADRRHRPRGRGVDAGRLRDFARRRARRGRRLGRRCHLLGHAEMPFRPSRCGAVDHVGARVGGGQGAARSPATPGTWTLPCSKRTGTTGAAITTRRQFR